MKSLTSKKTVLTGNYAAAYAARLCRPQVVAAYPITPQTSIIEKLSEFLANEEANYRMIRVESEQSAMAACMGAALAGSRIYTATASQGLALMHEIVIWAAGQRIPIVMSVVNRAFGPPWSIWSDQQDTMAERDTGWMQIYTENNQEVLDSIIMAYKIAESHDILLPMMVVEDAFILSHTMEVVEVPPQELVDEFLPPYDLPYKIDLEHPRQYGTLTMPDQYMEFRYKIAEAMERAKKKIVDVAKEFQETFGRYHGDLLDLYRVDDADTVMILMGAMSSTAKNAVDILRDKGHNVGVVRIRSFRPFPAEMLRDVTKNFEMIGVVDRSYTFGHGGPIFNEVRSALMGGKNRDVLVKDYVAGLGGRDVSTQTMINIFEDMLKVKKEGEVKKEIEWIDLLV